MKRNIIPAINTAWAETLAVFEVKEVFRAGVMVR